MAVRWLRQSAAMIADEDTRGAELARTVQARAEQFLAGSEKQSLRSDSNCGTDRVGWTWVPRLACRAVPNHAVPGTLHPEVPGQQCTLNS